MDSHCILACMNIFSVHLLLLEFFSRLTLLHDFFSSLCIDNTFTRIYILFLFSISRSRKYQYFLVKFLNKKSLHSALMFSRQSIAPVSRRSCLLNPVGASEFFLSFLCNCLSYLSCLSYFTTAKMTFTSIYSLSRWSLRIFSELSL